MKKILGLLVIVLGLTGCSMNAPTQMFEESSQNKIEWIVTDDESRAASTTPTWETGKLEYVTIEIYKVPSVNRKFIHEEKELLETKKLYRGESFTVPSSKDYDYKYITCIKIIEFDSYRSFYAERNEIKFFDYGGTVGMEVSNFYNCQIDDLDDKGWKSNQYSVSFRDPVEGYFITYDFLDKSVSQNFYDEYKDEGRIIWDNN